MSDQEFTSSYQVVMPRLGLTMVDGKIIEWYKKDGDWVEKGEALFSIENEKATLDIESTASGKLEIQVQPDIVVPILTLVGLIHSKEQSSSHHATPADVKAGSGYEVEKQAGGVETEKVTRVGDQVPMSPRARKIAQAAGLDVSQIEGSGVRGMIVTADLPEKDAVKATPVARKVASETGVDLGAVSGSGPRGMVRKEDVVRRQQAAPASTGSSAPQPLSGLRKVIAERLGKSWSERPQANLTTEVDASLFVKARVSINLELAKQDVKISYNTLLIKLVAETLREFPALNVSLLPEGLLQHTEINIGLAVDTERGLMVPVVRNASNKDFVTIQRELDAAVSRTLNGNASWEDLTGGTFSITNLGAFDIDTFNPIINPPECAILAIGRIHAKPVVVDGQIVIREMMALSISFDHRLVDGAPAARFLQRIKQFVEQPFLWSLWN